MARKRKRKQNAAVLVEKTGAILRSWVPGAKLGVVLSFMMGVTTLSLPSMVMLKKAIKPKLLGIFIAICTVGIIIVGYLFNALQYLLV